MSEKKFKFSPTQDVPKESLMVPDKDTTWMRMCEMIGRRSKCIFYKVGAVIVDPKKDEVVSMGYNGPVRGDVHCVEVGCAKKNPDGTRNPEGRCRGSHGEMNAMSFADGRKLKDATLYCLFRPCRHCAKQMVNAGIKRLVFAFDYDDDHWVPGYLEERGMEIVHLKNYETVLPGTVEIAEFLVKRGIKFDGDSAKDQKEIEDEKVLVGACG